MTDPTIMKSKDPTWEVVSTKATASVAGDANGARVDFETWPAENGWCIEIASRGAGILLSGPECAALAQFIQTNVRKRW